jgi:hypothetical protein
MAGLAERRRIAEDTWLRLENPHDRVANGTQLPIGEIAGVRAQNVHSSGWQPTALCLWLRHHESPSH